MKIFTKSVSIKEEIILILSLKRSAVMHMRGRHFSNEFDHDYPVFCLINHLSNSFGVLQKYISQQFWCMLGKGTWQFVCWEQSNSCPQVCVGGSSSLQSFSSREHILPPGLLAKHLKNVTYRTNSFLGMQGLALRFKHSKY